MNKTFHPRTNTTPILKKSSVDESESSTIDSRVSNKPKHEFNDYRAKFKTEICKHFTEYGFCVFGLACAFAHGAHELRNKSTVCTNKYRTKPCYNFEANGYCPYGTRCQFSHIMMKAKQRVIYFERKISYVEQLDKIVDEVSLNELQTNQQILSNRPRFLQIISQGTDVHDQENDHDEQII